MRNEASAIVNKLAITPRHRNPTKQNANPSALPSESSGLLPASKLDVSSKMTGIQQVKANAHAIRDPSTRGRSFAFPFAGQAFSTRDPISAADPPMIITTTHNRIMSMSGVVSGSFYD